MTTNKPNVQRYADMGCPEQICRVDTMQESYDGDFVLYEDYEALQAECDQLRAAIRRLCNLYVVDDYYTGEQREECLDAAVGRAIDATKREQA